MFPMRTMHQHPIKFSIKKHLPFPSYQVKKAEILLAVHSILTHTTQRKMEIYVKLTKVLFADSKVPQQLKLGRTKLGYLLQFGLCSILFSSLLPVTGFAPHLEVETNG